MKSLFTDVEDGPNIPSQSRTCPEENYFHVDNPGVRPYLGIIFPSTDESHDIQHSFCDYTTRAVYKKKAATSPMSSHKLANGIRK